jgi:hypothetical protein
LGDVTVRGGQDEPRAGAEQQDGRQPDARAPDRGTPQPASPNETSEFDAIKPCGHGVTGQSAFTRAASLLAGRLGRSAALSGRCFNPQAGRPVPAVVPFRGKE